MSDVAAGVAETGVTGQGVAAGVVAAVAETRVTGQGVVAAVAETGVVAAVAETGVVAAVAETGVTGQGVVERRGGKENVAGRRGGVVLEGLHSLFRFYITRYA